MDGPIVAGTDGSESATRALETAIELASAFDQELVIVMAYRPTTDLPKGIPAEFADLITPMSSIESTLDKALASARAAGVDVSTRAIPGDAADVLLRVAEEIHADLIVIGNKGIGSLKRFVLGNVPSKIVHNAQCSIHIVHTS